MKLSSLALDALTEIFNHGVGQAGHALSQLAGAAVRLSIPLVQEISKREVTTQLVQYGIHNICAVRQGFGGVVSTEAVLMFPVEQSLQLVQMMVGDTVPLEQLGEMEQESLAEIGNILLNSVVASVADLLRIEFEGSLPQVELGPIFDVLCPDGEDEDRVLSLQINFDISSRQIRGYLVFLLDIASGDMLEQKVAAFLAAAS